MLHCAPDVSGCVVLLAVAQQEKAAGHDFLVTPLPIFSAATRTTSFILAHFLTALQVPGWLLHHSRTLLACLAGLLLLSVYSALRASSAHSDGS